MSKEIIQRSAWPFIVAQYKEGKTLYEIGEKYGVSRERIRQIIAKCGEPPKMGGAALRGYVNRAERLDALRKRRDERSVESFGCKLGEAISLNQGLPVSNKTSLAAKYRQQKANAKKRGIDFLLTFPQWIAVWDDSGYLAMRGRGQGYCMARIADQGAYEVGNVYICTIGENFSHSYILHPASDRREKAAANRSMREAANA